MTNTISIRDAIAADHAFIFELSPRLAEVAKLPWHSDNVMRKMQDDYIAEMLAQTSIPRITLIAEKGGESIGFIHACSHKDEISGEACGTVPLLAVSPSAQGMGIGQLLMNAAEVWAKEQGYRLLHLEVFANNDNARGFYQKLGFQAETLHMIKALK
jgi:ribosomal protein S18 acetylase RimI-like enzyme